MELSAYYKRRSALSWKGRARTAPLLEISGLICDRAVNRARRSGPAALDALLTKNQGPRCRNLRKLLKSSRARKAKSLRSVYNSLLF